MLKLKSILVAACLVMSAEVANAELVYEYSVSGTFGDNATTLSGGFEADASTGAIISGTFFAQNVPVSLPFSLGFGTITSLPDPANSNQWQFTASDGFVGSLDIHIDTPSLIGFLGGAIVDGTLTYAPFLLPPSDIFPGVDFAGYSTTGLRGIVTFDGIDTDFLATPLPASLPLFVSGLGLIGFTARRRRKQRTAAA